MSNGARPPVDEPPHPGHVRRRGGVRSRPEGLVVAALGRGLDTAVGLTVALCAFIVVSRLMAWTIHPFVVLGQAALPLTMVPAWFAMGAAAVRRLPIRFVLALLLVVSHVLAVLPATGSRPLPAWARIDTGRSATGPPVARLRILTANVFHQNSDPRLPRVLMAADADVVVLIELSPGQHDRLERAGMFDRFPHRVETTSGAFGQTVILSRTALTDTAAVPTPGRSTPVATVDVQGRAVRIIAAHPQAPVDRCCLGELVDWLHWARDQGRSSAGPMVLAGDFNATRFFPAMGELFASGFIDAHEASGRGLSASWPAGGDFFDLPFMRLDHVLYRGDLAVAAVHDLRVPGSDHLGVVADLVVR